MVYISCSENPQTERMNQYRGLKMIRIGLFYGLGFRV